MDDTTVLKQITRDWIEGDPDPKTQAELEVLLAGDTKVTEWADRMDGLLGFGTAGLRGKVEAGSNRMNRAVVIRATAGLATWLDRQPERGPVIVGRDARLSSEQFMSDTVGVLLAHGFEVKFVPEPIATPIVGFLVLQYQAIAAVVITASHNPPADNGYKVYASNGCQIIPPTDSQISAAIAQVGPANQVQRVTDPYHHPSASPIADATDRYLTSLQARLPSPAQSSGLSTVYTPLHGVGGAPVLAAWERFGLGEIHPVAAQFQPDGTFPTTEFPNPEEKGAMDLALAAAVAHDADLVLANDPDTDRLAVAWPHPEGWRTLTGNQIGILLAEYLLSHTTLTDPLVIYSIVSTPMVAVIAEQLGGRAVPTLTGFKWIWNAALQLQERGEGNFLFGFEEALGYSVWDGVRDKDGISAAVVFAQMMSTDRTEGKTGWERLEGLYQRFGRWTSHQRSVMRPGGSGQAEIAVSMSKLSEDPPSQLCSNSVVQMIDYRQDADQRPPWLGSSTLIELRLADGGRVLMRPSGTEPKLKIYVDLVGSAHSNPVQLENESRLIAAELIHYVGLDQT